MEALQMTPQANSWNDDRLDELSHRTGEGFKEVRQEMQAGFARVDGEIKEVRQEMQAGFARVDGEFKEVRGEIKEVRQEMKDGFGQLDAKFDRLTNTLIIASAGIIAAVVTTGIFG